MAGAIVSKQPHVGQLGLRLSPALARAVVRLLHLEPLQGTPADVGPLRIERSGRFHRRGAAAAGATGAPPGPSPGPSPRPRPSGSRPTRTCRAPRPRRPSPLPRAALPAAPR